MAAFDFMTDGESAVDADAPASRAERRDQQVHRVMDAAKRCFVRSGFQGASMHQICAEAGMSPGALYRYFPSKEAMIAAITEADRRNDAEIFTAMFQNPDVVDGFVTAAIAHVRHMHESGNAPLFAEIRAESMRNEAIERTCTMAMCDVQQAFRKYLQDAVDRGDIAPAVELDAFMPMVIAIGEGLAINDLPAQGVTFEDIEKLMRVTVEAMLRPRRKT
ncbi:MAG: TetR/AcrR family transcriptional regulator [Mesorhizobium sp.]|nr:TetR/AcrR family transcriptional regulator [Mesorhizobium sp.]MCO5159571.1 TetR/AcrR family transcriptional regulator [Mesorhizobium sp.]